MAPNSPQFFAFFFCFCNTDIAHADNFSMCCAAPNKGEKTRPQEIGSPLKKINN